MPAGSRFLNRVCPAGKNCPRQYTPISSIIDTTAGSILALVEEAEIASHDFNGNVRESLDILPTSTMEGGGRGRRRRENCQ